MDLNSVGTFISSLLGGRARYIFFIIAIGAWILLLFQWFVPIPEISIWLTTYRLLIFLIAFGATIFVLAGLLYDYISWHFNEFREGQRSTKEQEQREAKLQHLSFDEQQILRKYIADSASRATMTAVFDFQSSYDVGVIKGLENKEILYIAAERQSKHPTYHHATVNIAQWAYDYLLKHPELVKTK